MILMKLLHPETDIIITLLFEYISYYYFSYVTPIMSKKESLKNLVYFLDNYNFTLKMLNNSFAYSCFYADLFEKQKLTSNDVQYILEQRYLDIVKILDYDKLLLNHINNVILPINKKFNNLLVDGNLINRFEWNKWIKTQNIFIHLVINN